MTHTLITGASSGLGKEFARIAAAEKRNVILVARRQNLLDGLAAELREAYHVDVRVFACDLSDSEAIEKLVRTLEESRITVDVLINNAGFGGVGRFDRRPMADDMNMIAVNISALTKLTRLLLPSMIDRKEGKILNVASVAAFMPGPYMSVYYATKAFVLSFSLGLREEMKDTNLSVTCLCPGATKTEFAEHSGTASKMLFRSPGIMDARTVAQAGWNGCLRGKGIVIPGMLNKTFAFLTRLSPRSFAAKMAMRVQR